MQSKQTYLIGYTVALMLALTQAVSVFIFFLPTAPLLLRMSCVISCFFLNIILYWRSFPDILAAFKQKNNAWLASTLTICACTILYVFSLFSFRSLRANNWLLFAILPMPIVQGISICTAIGNFGLYIGDCQNTLKNSIPTHLIGACILSLIPLAPAPLQIPLFIGCYLLLYLLCGKDKLLECIAASTSITLCLYGYGTSLPMLYEAVTNLYLRIAVATISIIGLGSLMLCDLIYSVEAVRKFQPSLPSSFNTCVLSTLAILNAVANAQLSLSAGIIPAVCGGIMSFVVMNNSIKELASDTTQAKPPYTQQRHASFVLFLYNIALIGSISTLIAFCRPRAFNALKNAFNKPLIGPIRSGTVGVAAFIGVHLRLDAANKAPQKLAYQP